MIINLKITSLNTVNSNFYLYTKQFMNTSKYGNVQGRPGAQGHLIHISRTKGLTFGMIRTLVQNPKTAFLRFRRCG